MALNWWILFRWEAQQDWNFALFSFLLLTPTVSFLLTVILFPDPFRKVMDFKANYYEDNRWFFALAAILPPLYLVDTALKGVPHLMAQGPTYLLTIPLISALSIAAVGTKNETYHKFFAVFFLLYIIIFIAINLYTIV